MSITVEIPEEVLAAIRFPREQLGKQLPVEMAYALYARGMASLGTARRLANLDKWSFLEGLAERKICRHVSELDLEEDIAHATSSHQ